MTGGLFGGYMTQLVSLSLRNIVKPEETASFDFPALDGLSIQLCYLGRDRLNAIRKECIVKRLSRGEAEESLDLAKFNILYSAAVIKGWKGFKLSYLSSLMLVDLPEGADPDSELEYTPENAEVLLRNSNIFDKFVSDILADLSNFTQRG